MHGTVVGVFRGGPSGDHEASLRSGHAILTNLPRERFTARDIYIDRQGVWHERGLPTTPGRVLPSVDIAVVAVRGNHGEDGALQQMIGQFGVPYLGPDPFHAFHSSHKVFAKERASDLGILTPKYAFAERAEKASALAREAVRSFHQPVIVKPVDASQPVRSVLAAGYKPILDAATAILEAGARGVLVEEVVRGVPASVVLVEGLRGDPLYALPVIELAQGGEPRLARLSREVSDELSRVARLMHGALAQRHYSRTDFIVSDKGPYFIGLASAPGVSLDEGSIMHHALSTTGVKLPEFLSHVLEIALRK